MRKPRNRPRAGGGCGGGGGSTESVGAGMMVSWVGEARLQAAVPLAPRSPSTVWTAYGATATTSAAFSTRPRSDTMPDRIPGITMLHQMSPLHCWAACAESVLQYYGINQNQQQINAAFGGGPMGGTPAPALNHHHVLASRTDHPQRLPARALR